MDKLTKEEWVESRRKNDGGLIDEMLSAGWEVVECDEHCEYEDCRGWRIEPNWEKMLHKIQHDPA